MKEKKDALSKVAQDLAVKLYQQNSQNQQGQGGQAGPTDDGSNGANGDTVDGDFTKVDPDK